MKYSLVIHKNGCKTIEIKDFSILSKYENLNENTLEDIVKFTNEFSCEEELIEHLLTAGLIPKNYYNGTIGIKYYRYDNQAFVLQYGVSYAEDAKFFDLDYLKHYYLIQLTNSTFMEEFIKKYYEKLKDKKLYAELLNYIRYSYTTYANDGYLRREESEYYQDCIKKFIKFYCTRKVDGKYKPSIVGIRDLAMFAINFERKHNKKEKTNKFKNSNYQQELELEISHYQNLANEEGITQEEFDAYMEQISRIQAQIDLVNCKDTTKTRRKKDETTEY